MAVKRKLITLSLYQEDLETLDWVAAEVGLGRSETVRRLVEKAYLDDKTRAIIKRGFKPTLNNAHYATDDENQKPGDQTGPDYSSLQSNEIIPGTEEELIAEAKAIQDKAEREARPFTKEEWKRYKTIERSYEIQKNIRLAKINWLPKD